MPKFRKVPVVIEAVEWTGLPEKQAWPEEWVPSVADWETMSLGGTSAKALVIPTLEGNHTAAPGDMIIRGVKGEFYPCKPDIFAKTYEPA